MDPHIKYSYLDVNEFQTENPNSNYERPHYNEFNPIIREYLETHQCSGALLDLGCGYGPMSHTFSKMGFHVTAIDGDCERIEDAKSKYANIDFKCFEIESTLPFEDNSFDVLFSRSVFQYIDHESILKECNRVLKKDGSLIILENLKNNPITRIVRTFLKLTDHKYHSYPWNHFTLSEISNFSGDFKNSSLHFSHLFSPLAYLKTFRKFYPLLFRIDQSLLKIKFLRNFAWLVLLTAKNK